MNCRLFLLLNLALAFYNVGTIWAHEVDIFRSWKLLDASTFHRVQAAHWHKLPYWVLLPAALALFGSIALLWCHPFGSPAWAISCAVACQLASHILTVVVWGRWQAKLSQDPRGSASPYLARILSTHWVRTALVSGYALVLLIWTIGVLALAMKPAAKSDQLFVPSIWDESSNQILDEHAPCTMDLYSKELLGESTEERRRHEQVCSEPWVDLTFDSRQSLLCGDLIYDVWYLLDKTDKQGR